MTARAVRATDWGPDLREQVARMKLGNPENFKFYGYEVIGNARDLLMTGCVTTRTITRGKRAGQPAYEGEPQRVVVSTLEIEHEGRDYEARTGRCSSCLGDGLELAGWNRLRGAYYRMCTRCGGSGEGMRLSDPPLKNDEARSQQSECGVGAAPGAKLAQSPALTRECEP